MATKIFLYITKKEAAQCTLSVLQCSTCSALSPTQRRADVVRGTLPRGYQTRNTRSDSSPGYSSSKQWFQSFFRKRFKLIF